MPSRGGGPERKSLLGVPSFSSRRYFTSRSSSPLTSRLYRPFLPWFSFTLIGSSSLSGHIILTSFRKDLSKHFEPPAASAYNVPRFSRVNFKFSRCSVEGGR